VPTAQNVDRQSTTTSWGSRSNVGQSPKVCLFGRGTRDGNVSPFVCVIQKWRPIRPKTHWPISIFAGDHDAVWTPPLYCVL